MMIETLLEHIERKYNTPGDSLLSAKTLELINEHKLESWALDRWTDRASPKDLQRWQNQCQKYKVINTLYLCEFAKLQQIFPQLIPLKGLYLLKDVYSRLEQRPMTDFDLLIAPQDLAKCEATLLSWGYRQVLEKKWRANHYKSVWTKHDSFGEMTCELHTQLFPQEGPSCSVWSHIDKNPHEMHLTYMCFHYALQHGFLKIFWLFDIYLFVEKYIDTLDPQVVVALSRKFKVQKAVTSCLSLCDNPALDLSPLLGRLSQVNTPKIDLNFLLESRNHLFKLLWIKHKMHDLPQDSLRHHWAQLKARYSSHRRRQLSPNHCEE